MFLKIIHKSEASFVCVLIRKEVILNRLEDPFALNVCAQNFSMSEIIVEGFKIEQKQLLLKQHFFKKPATFIATLG